jgi:HlyD family secretion protein
MPTTWRNTCDWMVRKPAVAALTIVAVVVTVVLLSHGRSSKPKYITAIVTRGSVVASVEATGTINPLTTVPVGSYVSGTVKFIFADFNSHVHAGDVLAQIDPDVYEARLVEARGNLAKSVASLRNSEAALAMSDTAIEAEAANTAKAEADLAYAKANAHRVEQLQRQGLSPLDQKELSQSTFTQADATARVSRSRTRQAAAQRNQALAVVGQARAEIAAMTGALQEAESNLRYTTILSPTDGVAVARNITVGQSVAASLQAPNLFTIAQDLQRMQVYAKTDESDTGFIRTGAEATFQVDAFPTELFHGRVGSIRLNAYTVSNVVTYDTVIDFDNPDERLLPGETAYVTISTGKADNAILVPNAAISYTPELPPAELERLYRQFNVPKAAYTSHRDNQQVVWKMTEGGDVEPVSIRTGLSDSSVTQLLSGALKERDSVLTGSMSSGSSSSKDSRAPIPNRSAGGRR